MPMNDPERIKPTGRAPWVALVASLVIIGIFFFVNDRGFSSLLKTYEDIEFMLAPSAERAFDMGRKHLDARNPDDYDINRAEEYYEKAVALNPALPYVFHELARIAFLRGDFEAAMAYINEQIHMHGDFAPNSYYVRGLIEGYMGDYDASIRDYEHFLSFEPRNWAAINDYAWVLLKAGRSRDAVVASAGGLALFPDNPWLLNTNAIGLYELGLYEAAHEQARKAVRAVGNLTEYQWLTAYPGNDPRSAADGIRSFQDAVVRNMHNARIADLADDVE